MKILIFVDLRFIYKINHIHEKDTLITTLFVLNFILLLPRNQVSAQRPVRNADQASILGWTDDSHYILRTLDTDKKPVTLSVDIKTGKSTPVPPSKNDRELLTESLPSDVTIGVNDVVSPDMKSTVIIKDNDLWLFVKGEKELKRLTSDEKQEVNARFSPDGKKIAYTKEKRPLCV
ncbi:MAG: hypothetical protein MZV63_16270 [Marinilabiliales bacterium]|nr:hypothetical protein [Marinilabiliales bacterium]